MFSCYHTYSVVIFIVLIYIRCSPIAQVLVSSGATVDLTGGSENWTPLFYAAMAGESYIILCVNCCYYYYY